MECTQCKSDNVQRLSVIYQSGTQHMAATRTTTGGTSQSVLALKAAPPRKKSYGLPISIILGNAVFLIAQLFFLWLIVPSLAAVVFLVYRAYHHNKKIYPPQYQTWRQSWHCNKCGTIYTVAD